MPVPPCIYGQCMVASHYHQRFYGGPPDADGIRYGKEIIAEFIRTLASLD